MRILIVLSISISVLAVALVLPVSAEQFGRVTATVTPKLISIVVSPSTLDYGALSLGNVATSDVIVATNNGNVAEDFIISGSAATAGGDSWSLSTVSPGENVYRHLFDFDPYDSFTPLENDNVPFDSNITASDSRNFKLRIEMPTLITGSYEQYETVVTISASEH